MPSNRDLASLLDILYAARKVLNYKAGMDKAAFEVYPMTALTVSLPEALTTYLQEQLASGQYKTADDYIQALIQQDKARKDHLEPLILTINKQ